MIRRPAIGTLVKVRNVPGFRRVAGRIGKVVAHHTDGVAFSVALCDQIDARNELRGALLVDPCDVDLAEVPT